jgi:dynein light intermediate chain, axonemal
MSEHQPRESLVQYQDPEIINPNEASKLNTLLAAKKKGGLPVFETKPTTTDVLNAILPPKTWTQDGKHYVQYVSPNPSSRDDVANLQKLLDERLLARQAR